MYVTVIEDSCSNKPSLVSCLCVTEKRPEKLDIAISQFYNQTHQNKELVVVCKAYDTLSQKCLDKYDLHISKVVVPDNLSLGEMRNASISAAKGDFICQWDDDDWYSPQRIESQLRSSLESKKSGSILLYVILFDEVKSNSYLSFMHPWDGSLFIKKDALSKNNIQYPSLSKREDTAVINKIIRKNLISPQISPLLYIYKFTGENTWDDAHFNNLFSKSCLMDNEFSEGLKELMAADIQKQKLLETKLLEKIDYFYNYKKKIMAERIYSEKY